MSTDYFGRDALFHKVQQHVSEPIQRGILVIEGQAGMGKTSFLQACSGHFPDHDVLLCWLVLDDSCLMHLSALYQRMYESTLEAFERGQFSLSRLPSPPVDTELNDETFVVWFHEAYLPQAFQIIRHYRYLVFLVDDADLLLNAIDKGNLSVTLLTQWQSLLETHPQLSMIITINPHRINDDSLDKFIVDNMHRLMPFTQNEVVAWCQKIGMIDAKSQEIVWGLAGGHPRWTHLLIAQWQTMRTIDGQSSALVESYQQDLTLGWQQLSSDDKRLLQACAGAVYDDPIKPLTAERLHTWLAYHDTPFDMTTIKVLLRGLEYQHWIMSAPTSVALRGTFIQRWLLEKMNRAGLNGLASSNEIPTSTQQNEPRLMLIGIAIAVIVALVLIILAQPSNIVSPDALVPTVTLAP
jgi:hypothetical protein